MSEERAMEAAAQIETAPWARQFGHPFAPVSEAVFAAIVTAYSAGVTSHFLASRESDIAKHSTGLVEYLRTAAAQEAGYDAAWDVGLGLANRSMTSANSSAIDIAVRLGLHLAQAGYDGAWTADLQGTPVQCGSILAKSVRRVEVQPEAGLRWSVLVTTDDTGTIRFSCGDSCGDSQIPPPGVGESLCDVGLKRPIYLLPGYGQPTWLTGGLFDGAFALDTVGPEIADVFRRSVQTIHSYSAEYTTWVDRVLRMILVCPQRPGFRMVSGSGEDAPGVVHISYPLLPIEVAELLVHESTHQYFYMLEWVGPTQDPEDDHLYWSPPIRMNRPLSRVLMAFHALANVRFFYDLVERGNGPEEDRAYVAANLASLEEDIAVLDGSLRGNPALTPTGTALYESLTGQLRALTH